MTGEVVWEVPGYTGEVVCARCSERVLGLCPVHFLGPSVIPLSSQSVHERMLDEWGLGLSPTSRNWDFVIGQRSKSRVVQYVSGSGDT